MKRWATPALWVANVIGVLLIVLVTQVHAASQRGERTASASVDFRIVVEAALDARQVADRKAHRHGQQRRVEHLANGRQRVTVSWP